MAKLYNHLMGYIYKVIHIPTQNYYIGKRCSFKDFDSYYGSGSYWKKFMSNKPIGEFRKEILAIEDNKEKLSDLEIFFIGDKWKTDHFSTGGHCYNCSQGGDGGFGHITISEEHRKKLSEAAKRQWARMTDEEKAHMSRRGTHLSKETKEKIHRALLGNTNSKGRPAWNKGKKMGAEFSEKVSRGMKRRYKKKNMASIA